MPNPKVSILWLNYNSSHIMSIVLQSLNAIAEIDYDNLELIIVDNASTDTSFKTIVETVNSNPRLRKITKIIRNEQNLGFAGGMNVAFRARDPETKYVVLLNNDAIPYPESVKELVEYMENHEQLGAAQGVLIRINDGKIDTAGDYMSKYIYSALLLQGRDPPGIKKPLYITYPDGAFSIIRVKHAQQAMGGNRLFYDELFAYCDDNILGLRLWQKGYRVATFPIIIGKHQRGSTFKLRRFYYYARCVSMLYHNSDLSRTERLVVRLAYTKRMLAVFMRTRRAKFLSVFKRAWIDGKELARKIKPAFTLKSAPLMPTGFLDVVKLLTFSRYFQPDLKKIEELYAFED